MARKHRVLTASSAVLSLLIVIVPAQAQPDIFGVYRSDRAETPCGRSANFGRNEHCPVKASTITAKNNVDDTRDDPGLQCVPAALVRLFTWFPRPMEIIKGDNEIIFRYEHFGVVRTIHMDGMPGPPDTWKSIHGFSTGRWEGDTLIVETTNLSENLHTIPTSDQATTIERYRWNGEHTKLLFDVTVNDLTFYDEPFNLRPAEFSPTPDDYIGPWACKAQTDDLFYGDIDAFFEEQ